MIEDILPLSPSQDGLLFHALYDAQVPDVYTVQLVLALQGRLDSAALQAAVQALLTRHANVRVGFPYENLGRPVQIRLRPAATGAERVRANHATIARRQLRPLPPRAQLKVLAVSASSPAPGDGNPVRAPAGAWELRPPRRRGTRKNRSESRDREGATE
jgi:Condensation domain